MSKIIEVPFSITDNEIRKVEDVVDARMYFHEDYIRINWNFSFYFKDNRTVGEKVEDSRSPEDTETIYEKLHSVVEDRLLLRSFIKCVTINNIDQDLAGGAEYVLRINDDQNIAIEFKSIEKAKDLQQFIVDWKFNKGTFSK